MLISIFVSAVAVSVHCLLPTEMKSSSIDRSEKINIMLQFGTSTAAAAAQLKRKRHKNNRSVGLKSTSDPEELWGHTLPVFIRVAFLYDLKPEEMPRDRVGQGFTFLLDLHQLGQEEDWELWASLLSMPRWAMEHILLESLSKCVQDGEVTTKS